MVGFIVLKKESTYICATCRKCMNAMKNYTYHLVAVLTVGIWGLTFISTKVLIGHGLSPQEIFLLRFLIAYMGIWLISPRKLFADNWKDEFWMFLGGMTGGSFYFFTEIQLWRLHWRRMCRLLSVRLRYSPPFFLCGFIKRKKLPVD